MSMSSAPDQAAVPDPSGASALARLGTVGGAVALAFGLAALAGLLAVAVGELLGVPASAAFALAASTAAFVVSMPLVLLLLKFARQVERQREQLARFEHTAPMPGAAARSHFLTVVELEWARARRYGHGAAVLIIEVDRFARLAEQHGAAAAAGLVDAMAHSTQQTLRGGDLLAAWSDSQIAVFLAHADALGALDAAERIRDRLEQLRVEVPSATLRATVSVGVATLRPAHTHLQALLDDAALAVLAARQAGGNCVRAAPVDAGPLQAPGPSVGDNQRAGPPA